MRAEAGPNAEAQRNVVYVILNRVKSSKFPNTVKGVIYQSGQFSCLHDGNFTKAKVTNELKHNVQDAYLRYKKGENAQGALFFTKGMFDRHYLFTDSVGHNFFK